MNEKRRTGVLGSMSTKMALVTLVLIVIAVTITVFVGMSSMRKGTEVLLADYAQNVSENVMGNLISAEMGGVEITPDIYVSMMSNVHMTGTNTSYVYMCDSEGTVLYHPTAEKIGTRIENEAVNNLVGQLQSGAQVENGAIYYVYNGVKKLAGYAITPDKKIIVTTADYDDVMASTNLSRLMMIVTNAVCCLFAIILSFAIGRWFFKPVKKIQEVIEDTADFNFSHNPELLVLCKRKDELGAIADEIHNMRRSLREIVRNIDKSSFEITENVNELKSSADSVNSMCTDNSATTQEIASGMEETSATTETINANIETMLDNAKGIDLLASDGAKISNEINGRAEDLKKTTITATQKTEMIYNDVRAKASEAIMEAKAVDRINEMTNTIMEISSQTSLLALNASIEAARAGDSGRGFAVVATEIGNLATQSSKTVSDIDAMVTEVVLAVKKMQDCLEETTDFIGENVLTDYKNFEEVSDQYSDDANTFKESMLSIRDAIADLNEIIEQVAESISGINATIAESANGVSGIAGNTSDIAMMTSTTAEKAEACKEQIDKLDAIVSKFTLE